MPDAIYRVAVRSRHAAAIKAAESIVRMSPPISSSVEPGRGHITQELK